MPAKLKKQSQRGDDPSNGSSPKRKRHRVKKLRLLAILSGLSVIAVLSTVFGILMALAADLPTLESSNELKSARNSIIFDAHGQEIGVLTGRQNRILVRGDQIAPVMKQAIISIEDKRFYENDGVDLRAMARAVVENVVAQNAVQGASTITQQFIKNRLQATDERTVTQKVREAALAYHLSRNWSKEKILTEYLNSIYFGNGAYGIESAARVYFGKAHNCGSEEPVGELCAPQLRPEEAALLAGMVQSPTAFDPVVHPQATKARRDTVLDNMYGQKYLTKYDYDRAVQTALPVEKDLRPPTEKSKVPYFTTWIKNQVVDRYGARRAYSGGLRIKTTLDLQLQQAAEQSVNQNMAGAGPSASMVVIDNGTGAVRAMVSGINGDYNKVPFNLATQGQRQPGSSFKPFVLATALKNGIGSGSVWASKQKEFTVPNSGGKEKFIPNNNEGAYAGSLSLAEATVQSDNSVYAEVGITVGTRKVARTARKMGIRTPVSHNLAMTLGGLEQGVTPLDMAHAYETIAEHGERISGTLAAPDLGPVGIESVKSYKGKVLKKNRRIERQAIPAGVADEMRGIMEQVVQRGTGKAAAVGQFAAGKTGTTDSFGDAWFVGFTEQYTAAVWVGYPDELKYMKTEFGGDPVMGGTFPAEIWHDFMTAAISIDKQREDSKRAKKAGKSTGSTTVTTPMDSSSGDTTATDSQDGGGSSSGGSRQGNDDATKPEADPSPAPTPDPEPDPEPDPAPADPAPDSGGAVDPGTGGAAPTG